MDITLYNEITLTKLQVHEIPRGGEDGEEKNSIASR